MTGITSATATLRSSSAEIDVTPASLIPHGTSSVEAAEVGVPVQGETM